MKKAYDEISESLYEKLLDCVWEHEPQDETVAETLKQLLSDQKIKLRPDKLKTESNSLDSGKDLNPLELEGFLYQKRFM